MVMIEIARFTQEELAELPLEYRDLAWVFEAEEVDEPSSNQGSDCVIELIPREHLPKRKLYSMSPAKWGELKEFHQQKPGERFHIEVS